MGRGICGRVPPPDGEIELHGTVSLLRWQAQDARGPKTVMMATFLSNTIQPRTIRQEPVHIKLTVDTPVGDCLDCLK